MYHRVLGSPDLVRDYGAPGVPRWERAVLPAFYPLVSRLIVRYLDIGDATAAESRERVRAVFDEVGERLADGRRYLVGDAFSAADLAFAALAASVVVPPPLRHPSAPAGRAARAVRRRGAGDARAPGGRLRPAALRPGASIDSGSR